MSRLGSLRFGGLDAAIYLVLGVAALGWAASRYQPAVGAPCGATCPCHAPASEPAMPVFVMPAVTDDWKEPAATSTMTTTAMAVPVVPWKEEPPKPPPVKLAMWCFHGCPPCARMKPSIEKLQAEGYDITVYYLEDFPQQAAAWKIALYPTLVWYREKVQCKRVEEFQTEAQLRDAFKEVAQ